ncbi:MAG: hypothetical protein ACYDD6_12510 [Acidimicrobiales bacterium]
MVTISPGDMGIVSQAATTIVRCRVCWSAVLGTLADAELPEDGACERCREATS